LVVASTTIVACDKKEDPPTADAAGDTPTKAPPPAAAGDPPPPPPPPQPGADQAAHGAGAPVSDEQLDRFATAFQEVQQLQSKIEKDLSTAESPADAKALQQEASQEAAAIVEKSGLSMTEYTQIAQRLQGDEALRQRLEEKVRDAG
jgi:hypothetical protein